MTFTDAYESSSEHTQASVLKGVGVLSRQWHKEGTETGSRKSGKLRIQAHLNEENCSRSSSDAFPSLTFTQSQRDNTPLLFWSRSITALEVKCMLMNDLFGPDFLLYTRVSDPLSSMMQSVIHAF